MAKVTKKTSAAIPALRIVSAREGFRRANRAWTIQPFIVAVSEFSDEELAQLKSEAMLTVEETEIAGEVEDAEATALVAAEEKAAADAAALAEAQALADAAKKTE